jgi:hypothetical protein
VTAQTTRSSAGRQKAPVGLTGGEGFRFENSVAARFLLDLLGGTNSLGDDFGRVDRVDWQARDAGWLVDDLAITCKLTGTGDDRAAGLSIKSDRQMTAAGFPAGFAKTLWEQWLGIGTSRSLSRSTDTVVLAVGKLAQNVEAAWSRLLREASETMPTRLVARLSSSRQGGGSQASELQRALFNSLYCPRELRRRSDTSKEVTARLLRQAANQ